MTTDVDAKRTELRNRRWWSSGRIYRSGENKAINKAKQVIPGPDRQPSTSSLARISLTYLHLQSKTDGREVSQLVTPYKCGYLENSMLYSRWTKPRTKTKRIRFRLSEYLVACMFTGTVCSRIQILLTICLYIYIRVTCHHKFWRFFVFFLIR